MPDHKQSTNQSGELTEDVQTILEKEDVDMRIRQYGGYWRMAIILLLCIWAILQVYYTVFGSISAMELRGMHAMFLVLFVFLLYPIRSKEKREKKNPPPLDLFLIWLSLGVFGYMLFQYTRVARSGGYLENLDLLVAAGGILIVLEAGRRTSRNLMFLALFFLSFNYWGQYVPGMLGHNGFTLRRVLSHMFWGSQGIFGVGIGVSATYIFLFVLFGAFLKYSGFSHFINDLSLAIVGRSPGGPAKVAVVASAFMGMINGSAIANVATTGTITIPMMKRTGYKPEFAGAVEAVASTGGQFCPPIMGAVGFVMAEFLGISYTKVLIAAIIPAFLYYFGLMVSVHLEAKKLGLKGISPENIPQVVQVIKERGHLSIPLFVLLGLLFAGYTPIYAAATAILSTVLAAALRKETRMRPGDIVLATEEGARSAIGVGIACVLIGIIIGTVSLTGLGLSLGSLILQIVGEGQLFIGGLLVMLMSVVLGMGVPGVAAYVIVVSIAVPVLISAGVLPIAAHMFCLIYACLSNITPPVAMSSYVAAGIAKSDMTRTSLIAIQLGITGFIIPFFFLNNPLLLLGVAEGVGVSQVLWAAFTAVIGVLCIAAGFEGWLLDHIGPVPRVILITAGLLSIDSHLWTDFFGISALFVIAFIQWNQRKHIKKEEVT